MRAEIKMITPELATELLKMNIGNRKVKRQKDNYSYMMRSGEWKENGEPIIIDVNGFIKDGQHRLHAVIESNFSYLCPIIYDVDPNVMDTIDTGTNRSLSDVLQLNGFANATNTSSLLKAIYHYEKGSSKGFSTSGDRGEKDGYLSNNKGLQIAFDKQKELSKLVKVSTNIYGKPNVKLRVLNGTEIGLILFIIGGYDFNDKHISFLKNITGSNIIEGSASSWVYKKLLSNKLNKISIQSMWKNNAIIKAWNCYVGGDIPVTYLRVDTKTHEKPLKLD
jgi:hypothetical protein